MAREQFQQCTGNWRKVNFKNYRLLWCQGKVKIEVRPGTGYEGSDTKDEQSSPVSWHLESIYGMWAVGRVFA